MDRTRNVTVNNKLNNIIIVFLIDKYILDLSDI